MATLTSNAMLTWGICTPGIATPPTGNCLRARPTDTRERKGTSQFTGAAIGAHYCALVTAGGPRQGSQYPSAPKLSRELLRLDFVLLSLPKEAESELAASVAAWPARRDVMAAPYTPAGC